MLWNCQYSFYVTAAKIVIDDRYVHLLSNAKYLLIFLSKLKNIEDGSENT